MRYNIVDKFFKIFEYKSLYFAFFYILKFHHYFFVIRCDSTHNFFVSKKCYLLIASSFFSFNCNLKSSTFSQRSKKDEKKNEINIKSKCSDHAR